MAQGAASDTDREQTWRDFKDAVNSTPAQLEKWLATEESQQVGQKNGSDESTGHHMGREIVALLRARKSDLGDEDYQRMRKVVGYVHRHSAQRPQGDVTDTRWRYSLMNWGHDPLKD